MATIATYLQFIEQNPNKGLMDTFVLNGQNPSNYSPWFDGLQNCYIAWLDAGKTTNLADLALAVYTYWTTPANVANWPDRLTSAQLTQALTSLKQPDQQGDGPSTTPAFPDATQITNEVNKHYLDISLVIDADSILNAYGNKGGTFYIGEFIAMFDNQTATSSGEGGDELSSQGLQPNMTITWTAVAKNKNHAIELTTYEPRDGNRFEELYPIPVAMPGNPSIWVTKANATLPAQFQAVYAFNLTIDNGSSIFWFDPYIGDGRAR